MLTIKLQIVDEELASGRWKTKLSKSHGRVVYLSLRDEKARYWKCLYSHLRFEFQTLFKLRSFCPGYWGTLLGPICSLKIMRKQRCSTGTF